MKGLRAFYMIFGWMVMLPFIPFICLVAWVWVKKEFPWMTGLEIWKWIGEKLILGIKWNIDFIEHGLK